MIRVEVRDLGRLVDQLEAGADDLVARLERTFADDQARARLAAAVRAPAPRDTGRLR